MFKILSLFKKNKDEQISDNEYDFNEASAPVIDAQGKIESLSPVRIDTPTERKQVRPTPPKIDTLLKDQADQLGIDQTRKELHTLSNDSNNKSSMIEVQGETPFTPDISLIPEQGVPREAKVDVPIGVTHFQKSGKSLDFVSVAHMGDLQDPVHRTVKEAIETLNPQMIITEGHATYRGSDEKNSILDHRNKIIHETREEVEKVRQNNNIQEEGTYIPEAGYAAYLAEENGIPSIGGEPTGKELFDGMKTRITRMEPQGYSSEAVIADAFLRQIQRIPLEQRLAMTEEEFVTNHVPGLLTYANERVDPLHTTNTQPLTFEQFKEWYAAHPLPEGRRFMDADYSDFTPHQDGNYYQLLACESGVVRDQHLAQLIADLLNEGNDRIMVVYGLHHLPSLKPVLENKDMFDSPGEFTNLVEEDAPVQPAFITPSWKEEAVA